MCYRNNHFGSMRERTWTNTATPRVMWQWLAEIPETDAREISAEFEGLTKLAFFSSVPKLGENHARLVLQTC